MGRVEQLSEEIQQLADQYRKEVTTSRRTWPNSIRDRALELQRLDLSDRQISKLTGIPVPTLYLWSKKYNDVSKGKFIPVEPVNKAQLEAVPFALDSNVSPLPLNNRQPLNFTVTLPQGIRIGGLDMDSLVEFTRRISK